MGLPSPTNDSMGPKAPPATQASPRRRKAKIEAPHHNVTIEGDDLDTIAEGILAGDTNETVAAKVGITAGAVTQQFKKFKEVELPLYFPETVDEWRDDVIKAMQIAVWKGAMRLAKTGMDEMDVRSIPVAVGIISDKLSGYMGNPTSISVIQHQVVRHDDVLSRLKQAKDIPLPPA